MFDESCNTLGSAVRLSLLAAVAGIGHLAAPLAHDVAPGTLLCSNVGRGSGDQQLGHRSRAGHSKQRT